MDEQKIFLITNGIFEQECLKEIAKDITREFNFPVSIYEGSLDLREFYDEVRRQYDGNRLLKEIEKMDFPDAIKKIGLFRNDIYIPILTFIFGQAIYKGNSGIASLYRLRNEQYGMKPDESKLLDRFKKVIIHELGHTFGLKHCYVPTCVMRSGTYVEHLDQKNHTLCKTCRSLVDR